MDSAVKSDTPEQSLQSQSVIDVFFKVLRSCSSQLFANRKEYTVIDGTKCLKEVSLYEFVLGKICIFSASLPPGKCFHILVS